MSKRKVPCVTFLCSLQLSVYGMGTSFSVVIATKNLAAGASDTDGQIRKDDILHSTPPAEPETRHTCMRAVFCNAHYNLFQQHDHMCMRAACSRRRAMRSAVCGCVENRFMSALPLPSSGFTMNICAVAGVASCIGRACVA